MFEASKHATPKTVDRRTNGHKAATPTLLDTLAPSHQAFDSDGVVVIGKGTKITGEITDSSILDIQGEFEGYVDAQSVIIREGASFKGNMESRHVEVHGFMEGALIADDLLDIHATGRVHAEVEYGELSVATGAYLTGSIQAQRKPDMDSPINKSLVKVNVLNGTGDQKVSIN